MGRAMSRRAVAREPVDTLLDFSLSVRDWLAQIGPVTSHGKTNEKAIRKLLKTIENFGNGKSMKICAESFAFSESLGKVMEQR